VSVLLALKCLLVPLCILSVTLAGRKLGAKAGGLIAGLPLVALAILLVLALEKGPAYAADASMAGASGLAAYVAYGAAYCWASRIVSWPLAYGAAALAWAASALFLTFLPNSELLHLLVGAASLVVAQWVLPPESTGVPAVRSKENLPARMAAGAALTIIVSALAKIVGGTWAGLFTAYPVLGSITLIGAHRTAGAAEAARLYRGMVGGAWSAVVCYPMLAFLLLKFSVPAAFLLATAATLCTPAAFLLLRRNATPANYGLERA